MSIINEPGERLRKQVYIARNKGESFSISVSWRVDENGKAIDFGENKCQKRCY